MQYLQPMALLESLAEQFDLHQELNRMRLH